MAESTRPAIGISFRGQPELSGWAAVYLCDSTREFACCASRKPLIFSVCMDNLFVFLALAQILVGLYLLYEGVHWLGYVRRRKATDPGFNAPRTAVLCPCKGIEPGLERNLTALCEFDYPNYEVFFAIASESDP